MSEGPKSVCDVRLLPLPADAQSHPGCKSLLRFLVSQCERRETTTLLPYDGEVTVSCASSPMATLMPIEPLGTPPPASPTPAPENSGVGLRGEDSSSDAVSMAVIAGCAGGGLALLILVAGLVVWRQRILVPQQPPPSYDDIVGRFK